MHYYTEGLKFIKKTGVGMAINHQTSAMKKNNTVFTLNKKDSYNILHLNNVGVLSMKELKKNQYYGKKVVITAHTTEEDYRDSLILANAVSPLLRRRLKQIYAKADLLISPTKHVRNLVSSIYAPNVNNVIISNGVDIDFFIPCLEKGQDFIKKYSLENDSKIILSVGLHIKRKGILDFIALAKMFPDFQFIWCGYTSKFIIPNEIKKAMNSASKNVKFIGYIPQNDLVGAYNCADIFLLPSHEETEGIVVLEALSCKTKVILRDIEVFEDWLTDGYDCLKAKNVQEFKQSILKATSGDYNCIVENGYKIAEDRSLEKVGKALKLEYEKLLKL